MKKLLISCEHGGNHIPAEYQWLFEDQEKIVASHRGWDIGALEAAKVIAKQLKAPLHYSETSRLLVELNRSLHHIDLFSEFTLPLSEVEKQHLLKKFYFPYRNQVRESIKNMISEGHEVVHISVHSFTQIFDGLIRNAQVGLLYDPNIEVEKEFCQRWKEEIGKFKPDWNVRYNYPYLGSADGLVTHLRKVFPENYVGIELEVMNLLLDSADAEINRQILAESLEFVMHAY